MSWFNTIIVSVAAALSSWFGGPHSSAVSTTTVPVVIEQTTQQTSDQASTSAQGVAAVSASSSSQIIVTGMTQYTDPNFGFSFWYPSTWIIQNQLVQPYLSIGGGTIVKSIVGGPSGDLSNSILIQEFQSAGMSVTDKSPSSPAGNGSLSLTYYFDPSTRTWMAQDVDGENHLTTYAANVSTNSMGGLHILGGNARFADDVIVPLSASHFLIISSVEGGTIRESVLANTITATNPAVATPLDAADQAQIIHTEGLMYGAIGVKVGYWYIDGNNVYDGEGNSIPSANASTFHLITTYSDGLVESLGTGFATDGNYVYSGWSTSTPILAGADPVTFIPIRQEYQIPYASSSGLSGKSFTSYDTTIAKDKTHVWYEGRLIPGADANTFVDTGMADVLNSTGSYTFGHDANHTYGVDAENNITIDGVAVSAL